jgi:MFS family permease
LLILEGAVMAPAVLLMGQARTIWQLATLTAIVWFCGGMGLLALDALTGLSAQEAERGKVFGIMAMTSGMGSLIGGATTGPLVDRWGYSTMFSALAVYAVLAPVLGLLARETPAASATRGEDRETGRSRQWLGRDYLLLLLATSTRSIVGSVGGLGQSLHMSDLGFAAAAITSTGAVSGVVSLPLQPAVGWLSDRVGRKRLLILGFLAQLAYLLTLAFSGSLWHFWLAMSVWSVTSASAAIGSALVTDFVPPDSLGRAMSVYSSSLFAGGIIGYAVGGYAIEALGVTNAFLVGAVATLLATGLIVPIRAGAPAHVVETAPEGPEPSDSP